MQNPFTVNSRRWHIAEKMIAGASAMAIYRELRPMVLSQTEPWVFKQNVGGSRVAKAIPMQLSDFRHELNRVAVKLGKEIVKDSEARDADNGAPEPEPMPEPTPEESEEDSDDSAPEPTPAPAAAGKRKRESEIEWFLREWKRVNEWVKTRADTTQSEAVDKLETLRIGHDARAAIMQGIPGAAMLYAMAISWEPSVRDAAGIEDFNTATFGSVEDPSWHPQVPYVLALLEANVPVFLKGDAGSGKTHVVRQCAEILGLEHGEAPLSEGAFRSDFIGKHTFEGFTAARFAELYAEGGIFLLDEFDRAQPDVLVALNGALASNEFHNPADGKVYKRHRNFRIAAAGNTWAVGAHRDYTTAQKLDFATRDRFRMGRVEYRFDWSIAEKIARGELTARTHDTSK